MPAFAVDMAAPPQQLVLIMFPAEAQPEMNPDTVFGLEMKARGPGPVVPYAGPVNIDGKASPCACPQDHSVVGPCPTAGTMQRRQAEEQKRLSP